MFQSSRHDRYDGDVAVSSTHDPVSTAFLLVETDRGGEPRWAVKWRGADGKRVKRRLLHEIARVERASRARWQPAVCPALQRGQAALEHSNAQAK